MKTENAGTPIMYKQWTAPLLIAMLLVIRAESAAQVEPPVSRDTVVVGRLTLTGYPYVFYNPEVEFAAGGALVVTSYLDASAEAKPSNVILTGWASTNSSYLLALTPEFFLSSDRIYVLLALRYSRYADRFWGIGPTSEDTIDAGYARKGFSLSGEVDVAVWGALKVGLNYELNNTRVTDQGSNPLLTSGAVTASDGGFTSGLGAVFLLDTRNGAFYPTSGGLYKLSFLNTSRFLGSEFLLNRWILDLRQYFALSDPVVLAVQAYASAVSGEAPFYMLPALGGGKIMRGYFEGRYRDRMLVTLQGEVRVRLFGRWGVAGWVGVGDVAHSARSFTLRTAKPSFGVGVRFALDPTELLNIRVDVAKGRESDGIYFDAKEAF